MNRALIAYRGVVAPAQCDAMHHMNVQYYIAAFDQALWHLMAEAGYSHTWIAERQEGWADRRYEIDFRRELRVGSLFRIASCITKVGRTSLTSSHTMISESDNSECAQLKAVSIFFDLDKRCAKPLAAEILANLQARAPDFQWQGLQPW